ncbi:radical SAM family heme chaperone HemW [Herbivorax sp. ANBcel31]|uniref:radical SAM family heme chaperone HemW n=1 Tax=Herbivorax sp. ANBcel31 TaxID=3069754 RepID=UPI0027B2A772|nr:radical SAM family heme chaperone HemW [Herbivorax sp. ANBcel31]MDQ2084985.1 radical SAM family heme chaperone HemW [Herbivorax sp. ANBcel31]
MKKKISLYIHIPFCMAKCYYCDFNSFPCRAEFIPAYFNALRKELIQYEKKLKDYKVSTIFIGGGTPSLVDANNIYELMLLFRQTFYVDKDAEITIESNPGTLSLEKLDTYTKSGINRLSIGLQAIQDSFLESLGRIHNLEEFKDGYKLALKAGFKNTNIDLIFGIPGQTLDDWKETLEYVIECEPAHLSCYSLKFEENTVFGEKLNSGKIIPVSDECDRKMYWEAIEKLKEKKYQHYEISNFSKKGFESRHNLVYWKSLEYIGIGAGAHSFFKNVRYNNIASLDEYVENINRGISIKENKQLIQKKDRISEYMILGLRLIKGVDMKDFKNRFEMEVLEVYKEQIKNLKKRNLIKIDGNMLKLTPLGLDLANQVFVEFL